MGFICGAVSQPGGGLGSACWPRLQAHLLAHLPSLSWLASPQVIIGPHGAGLAHALFAAPGTTLVEFLFLAEPPLMFWHTAAALGQDYWLLPVPQGHYMQPEMEVPVGEVLDILTAVLVPPPEGGCPPGSSRLADGRCEACRPGTYAFNQGSEQCRPCAPGRAAASLGSTACRTAQPGSYASADGTLLLPCPADTHSVLPGAWDVSQCLTSQARRQALQEQVLNPQLLTKLSPVFARALRERRRALIQTAGTGSSAGTAALTPLELCAAQQLAGGFEAYAGPYRMAEVVCPPTGASPMPAAAPASVLADAPAPALADQIILSLFGKRCRQGVDTHLPLQHLM